jgi:hypothetical protein
MITCLPPAEGDTRRLVIGLTPQDIAHLLLGKPIEINVAASKLPAGGWCAISVLFGPTAESVDDTMVLEGLAPASLVHKDPDVPAGRRG